MDNKQKYVTVINGVDLFKANTVQCACLIFNIDNVHPAILEKVEEWQQKQMYNSYWENPLHC